MREIKNDVKDVQGSARLFSYADDLTVIGPPADTVAIYNRIKDNGHRWGFHMQPRKCALSQPNNRAPFPDVALPLTDTLQGIHHDAQNKISVDRTQKILGIPLTLESQSVPEQVAQIRELIEDILKKPRSVEWEHINAHCAYHLLKGCMSAPLIN